MFFICLNLKLNAFLNRSLEEYYDINFPDFTQLRAQCSEILQKEEELSEIVQLVGKVAIIDCFISTSFLSNLLRFSVTLYYCFNALNLFILFINDKTIFIHKKSNFVL